MRNGILNEPVLILNVNFEPLHVTNIKRALSLILSGKAEIVLNGRGVIRSSMAEFEAPSVIKLGYMVRRPRPRVALSKREVLRRDNFTCQYCSRKMRFLTIRKGTMTTFLMDPMEAITSLTRPSESCGLPLKK